MTRVVGLASVMVTALLGLWIGPAGAQAPDASCGAPAQVTRRTPGHPPRRGDEPLARGDLVAPGEVVGVPDHALVWLVRRGVQYRARGARLAVECDAVRLLRGRVTVIAPRHEPQRARLALPGALFSARAPRTHVDVVLAGRARVRVLAGAGEIASARVPGATLSVRGDDVAIIAGDGLARLDTWPFARSPHQRPARPADHLPAFWADGVSCSVGCRPPGALAGWPLRPFHRQHPLRAGLNELRPDNMHVGLDIQAQDGTPVYAMQSGAARVLAAAGVDGRVQVGSYVYWHIRSRVRAGQHVVAHRTIIGTLINGAGHLHLSEKAGERYLNPLRPGGRVLAPWRDSEPPIIAQPVVHGAGDVTVEVFDPQSFRSAEKYRTPVLAPAALAYRTHDGDGREVSGLRFVLRGSQHLARGLRSVIFAPDAYPPGWTCFDRRLVCIPRWNYRLAALLDPAARSLSVYAWDWSGAVAVRRVMLR